MGTKHDRIVHLEQRVGRLLQEIATLTAQHTQRGAEVRALKMLLQIEGSTLREDTGTVFGRPTPQYTVLRHECAGMRALAAELAAARAACDARHPAGTVTGRQTKGWGE